MRRFKLQWSNTYIVSALANGNEQERADHCRSINGTVIINRGALAKNQ